MSARLGNETPTWSRNLPVYAASALAGNLLVHELPALPPTAVLVCIVALGVTAARFGPSRWLALVAAAFVYTALVAADRLGQRWPPDTDARDVVLRGWIDRFPATDPGRVVFSLRVERADRPNIPSRLRLSWYDAPTELAAGASVDVIARLRSPRGLKNPGSFDYERWLFVEGYGATGYVRSGTVNAGAAGGVAQRWLRFRAELAERIRTRVASPRAAALMIALGLGERTDFGDEQWTGLRRTGTTHLVAISGMHVGLMAAMSFWAALRVGLRLPYVAARHAWPAAAGFSAVVAAFYAALAGFAVPTQRALVMLFVALCALSSKRRLRASHGLALALVLVLAYDPFAPLSVSFWLSFAAVALLLLLAASERLRGTSRHGPSKLCFWARDFGKLQWCVTLGLAPFAIGYFGEVSLVAAIVNLVAIPLFSFVLVPSTLVVCACAYWGADAFGLVELAAGLADATWDALMAVSAWRWSAVQWPGIGVGTMVISLAGIWLALPLNPFPARRMAWLATIPLLTAGTEPPDAGVAEITLIDVGQGLAVVVETRDHRLLYDAGPIYRSGFDTGREIVVPVLRSMRRAALDLLIVSHNDSDHSGGAAAVLAAYPGTRVLRGPDVRGFSGEICSAGRAWVWNEVSFAIVHPSRGFVPRGNDSSCVLKVATAGDSILITGDIEARAERLLAREGNLRSDFVVVPHHGSATSSTMAFTEAVAPRHALVSAGHDNRWGFPRPEVRSRWEARGAAVWVTGDVGAIALSLGSGEPEPRFQRRERKRYWDAPFLVNP